MKLSVNGEIELVHRANREGKKSSAVEYRGGVLTGPDCSDSFKAGIYKGGFDADVKLAAKASGDFINQALTVIGFTKVY